MRTRRTDVLLCSAAVLVACFPSMFLLARKLSKEQRGSGVASATKGAGVDIHAPAAVKISVPDASVARSADVNHKNAGASTAAAAHVTSETKNQGTGASTMISGSGTPQPVAVPLPPAPTKPEAAASPAAAVPPSSGDDIPSPKAAATKRQGPPTPDIESSEDIAIGMAQGINDMNLAVFVHSLRKVPA